MHRSPLLAALFIFAACAVFPASLTQGERDRAMSELHATRKAFVDSISGLSEAQWNFKAGPDRWSIAECAEHIAVSEDSLFELVMKKVLTTVPTGPATDAQRKDQEVLTATVDRSKKAHAPEFLRPAKRWASQDQLIAHFKRSRDITIAFIRTTKEDLRAHSTPHPARGSMDAYQWILTIAAHSQRHVDQIQEVRADPRFPRR